MKIRWFTGTAIKEEDGLRKSRDRLLAVTDCPKGSCQRHLRCMYLNHPQCPFKGNADDQ